LGRGCFLGLRLRWGGLPGESLLSIAGLDIDLASALFAGDRHAQAQDTVVELSLDVLGVDIVTEVDLAAVLRVTPLAHDLLVRLLVRGPRFASTVSMLRSTLMSIEDGSTPGRSISTMYSFPERYTSIGMARVAVCSVPPAPRPTISSSTRSKSANGPSA